MYILQEVPCQQVTLFGAMHGLPIAKAMDKAPRCLQQCEIMESLSTWDLKKSQTQPLLKKRVYVLVPRMQGCNQRRL